MTFIHTAVLSALATALIPLLIHLLSRLRFKEVEFSSLKFLKRLERKRLRKVKIAEWLLLILRTLAIVLIVLAFARPALHKLPVAGFGEAQTAAALIIDNSLPSQASGPQGNAISDIRQRALSALNLFSQHDRLKLVTAGKPITSLFDNPLAGSDLRLRRAILRTEALDSPVDWLEAINSISPWLNKAPQANREIFLFSTFYGKQIGLDSALKAVGKDTRIYLVEIGESELDNIAITSLEIETRIFLRGNPVTLSVTVANHSANSINEVNLSLYLAEARIAITQVNLAPYGMTTAKLKFLPESPGFSHGEVRLELEDALMSDNRRYFAFYIPEELTLYIYGEPAEAQRVKIALKPNDRTDFSIEPKTITSLANLPQDIASSPLFLSGLKALSSVDASTIRELLNNGAAIAISPSPNLDANNLNRLLLQPLSLPQFTELVVNDKGEPWGLVDYLHPIFQGVFLEEAQIEKPKTFHYFQLSRTKGNDIIKFKNGSTFLREINVGEGRLLLFTSGFSNYWGDLAQRGIFAPLMHRTVIYLGNSPSPKAQQTTAGEVLIYNGEQTNYGYKLFTPNGIFIDLMGKTTKKGLELKFNSTGYSGLYELMHNKETKALFAVNPATEYSTLKRLRDFSRDANFYIGVDKDLAQSVQIARLGIELWRWILLVGILMLMGESILSKLLQ